MTYRIRGLDPERFAPMFDMSAAELMAVRAERIVADAPRGFPCRVSLDDAEVGESLLLLNFVSHDVETPFRTAFAIYVRQIAQRRAEYVDSLPPIFEGRSLSLRGFGENAMLLDAKLIEPGAVDEGIRALFADRRIAYIQAHNAAHGCFHAHIERHGELANDRRG